MSIPVIVRNVIWSKSGPSNTVYNWRMRDNFLDDDSYEGPAENYLSPLIYEELTDIGGETPSQFEWCYPWDQINWIVV